MTGDLRLPDAAARRRIRQDLDTSLLCLAGAGAGKTHALVDRMVSCVREGKADIAEMAAITFTRKAAGEMRGRFFRALQEESERVADEADGPKAARQLARLRDAESRVDQCSIGTIHSFCARLLRECPVEAGLPVDFAEVEEREELFLVRDAWDQFLQSRSAAGDERLLAIEDTGLTAEQFYQFYLDRCQYSDLPLKPTHGPRPDLKPVVAQACDFVRQVAGQIPDPLPEGEPDRLMVTVRELRHFVDFTGPPSDADRERLLRELASTAKTGVTLKRWGPPGSPEQVLARSLKNDVLPALRDGLIKPLLVQWRHYVYTLAGDLVDEAMVFYRDTRLTAATLTFTDLMQVSAELLRERPDVRARLRRRYRRLFVDEFQDTDPLQAEVLLHLTGIEDDVRDWRLLTPAPGSLFLVGDEKQSIYRFRRADLDIFRLARDRVLAGGGAVVELTTCFRARPQVTSWTNAAFEPLFDNHDARYQALFTRLDACRPSQEGAGVYQLRARAESGGRRAAQTQDEARRIAAFIAAALRGRTQLNGEQAVLGRRSSAGDFMILTRSRRFLSEYARALETEQVPYDITGAGSLQQSVELRAIVDALDTLLQPDNPVPLLAWLRGPLVGLGDDELYALRRAGWSFRWRAPLSGSNSSGDLPTELVAHMQQPLSMLHHLWDDLRLRPMAASLERFVDATGLGAHAAMGTAGSSRAGNLLRVLAMVRDAQNRRGLGWSQITDELRDLLNDDRQRVEEMTLETGRSDVVRIMNLHQAKGLEAKVVFLADAFDNSAQQHDVNVHVSRTGEQPFLSMAVTRSARYSTIMLAEPEGWEQDAAEEERYLAAERLRLVYVAATRACDVLVMGTTGQTRGAWNVLEPALTEVTDLPEPTDAGVSATTMSLSDEQSVDVAQQQQELRARWNLVNSPSWQSHAVTDEEDKHLDNDDAASRGRGRSYGTVVHRVFENAVRGRLGGLDAVGQSNYVQQLLSNEGVADDNATTAALAALSAFRASSVWQELTAAEAVYAEVPLAGCVGASQDNSIQRGMIDLVYRITGGWKIVDYKTHAALTPSLTDTFARQVAVYADHWEAVTGEKVAERGIWLATSNGDDRYIALS